MPPLKQEKEDILLSTWTRHVQSRSVGCFLLDAPMGLQGDTPWTLEQLVALLMQIHDSFTPPFTIVIFSQYSLGEVQRALAAQGSPGKKERLQLTVFLMIKVKVAFSILLVLVCLFIAYSGCQISVLECNLLRCRTPYKRGDWDLGPTRQPTCTRRSLWLTTPQPS